ncbi:MAG: carboxypeptidase-like regulatory domain-containing protein [Terracidiphilus sp.]
MMKISRMLLVGLVAAVLLPVSSAVAATVSGTVTNQTTGKPSAGDSVSLVDVQAGMAEVATATTDAQGRYSLTSPGMGSYLIRANHQGCTYFIAAPQGGGPGNITVYDVAAKVQGVGIDADMLLVEAGGGMLRVHERYLVRNTSMPPMAQFSSNTFEVAIPPEAVLDGASATRPGGLATNTHPIQLDRKGHYSLNVPIQPNKGEQETMFEVQYHLPYSGKYQFTPQLQMPADHFVVYAAQGMTFVAGPGSDFQATHDDPRVQTFVAKNVHPGQGIAFTVSGEGQMPLEAQGGATGPQAGQGMGADAGSTGNRPGGGLGAPIDTPDPISKYKWWLLTVLALAMATAAAVMLRRKPGLAPAGNSPGTGGEADAAALPVAAPSGAVASASYAAHSNRSAVLLNALKEELFAIEREKLAGTLSLNEYERVKTGLEAVLKRVLSEQERNT